MPCRQLLSIVLFSAFVSLALLPRQAAALTDEQIEKAIQSLVNKIYAAQNDQGTWDPKEPKGNDHTYGRNFGGSTALFTYALLTAGESYQNPKLAKAIEFLKTCEMGGTYAVGLRAHVWAALPPQFESLLQKDIYWLLNAQHPVKGHYNYTEKAGENYDNSVTQYGVLGVWEGAKRNQNVGTSYWKKVEDHFLKTQLDNGAWDYGPSHPGARGSMAAAGLACLYITQDYLHSSDFRTVGRAQTHPLQARINKGLEWFSTNYSPTTNPGHGPSHLHYYLYGVERVGLASGMKYFGGKDWYETGAEHIIKNPGGGTDMAFSTLFLVRGRVPVFVNKLSLTDIHWNNRPRDLANLTSWVSDEVEKKMIWQIVSLDQPSEKLLDSPILYFASHAAFELDETKQKRLKRFLDLGGTLITTADGGETAFTKSVQALCAKMYPDLKFKPLEAGDELLNVVFQTDNKLGVQSLHNGVRHLVLHIPKDVSWAFHSGSQADLGPWEFFTNAYYYATEKGQTRNRLDSHFVDRNKEGGGEAVAVGHARYGSPFWDPEPLAWEVQSNFMFNEKKATLNVSVVELASLPDPKQIPLIHVQGVEAVTFSEAELDSIKKFTAAGGTIFFENVGGRGSFAQSVIQNMAKAFPTERIRPISLNSPMISGQGIGGYDLNKVDYRPYTLLKMGRVDTPRLLAMTLDGEPRIIVSGEDISFAVLNQPRWAVFGYNSASAQKILSNIVLNAKKAAK
jgi:hypothetical protein